MTEEFTCTWRHDDGTVCGKPADAMRVRWIPERVTFWYCRDHIARLRAMTSDDELRSFWGFETYPLVAA
jgi:hypothetical protein